MSDSGDLSATSIGFLLFGLGFFTLMFLVLLRDDDKQYARKLNEAREFGYREPLNPSARPKRFGLF